MNAPKIKIPSKTNPVSAAPAAPSDDSAPVSETQNAAPAAPAPVAAVPSLSKEDKKSLFDRAFAYDDAVEVCLKQVEDIKAQKSIAVKAIHEVMGKGPFQYRGREITISSREGTFFFKDYGKRDLEAIDA